MISASRALAVLAALLGLAIGAQAGATYIGSDTTTQGSWIGVYGHDGYSLLDYKAGGNGNFTGGATTTNDLYSLPSYVSGYSYGGSDAEQYSWAQGTTHGGYKYSSTLEDPTQVNPATAPRNATTSFTGSSYTITISDPTAHPYILGVYGLDWDNFGAGGRVATVSIDGGPAQTYSAATGYQSGQWDRWLISGDTTTTLTLTNLNSNAVLSAITFDPLSSPVPEPASLTLLGLGSVALLGWRGRKRVTA